MRPPESRKLIPIACTLPSEAMDDRLGDWRAVLERAEAREATDDGLRLRFPAEAGLVATLAGLAAKEAECCAFFDFTLSIDHDGASLAVGAPPDGREVLLALFGERRGAD